MDAARSPLLAGVPATVPASPAPIIPLLSYQADDIQSTARFRWCCWSRQVGKSFTKSLRRLLRGLERRRTQIFLSAGERQSRELMIKAQQHCRALNLAAHFHGDRFFAGTSFKQLTIELPNRVRIIGLPANPQTLRGFTGDVFLDEFAMHRDDREIWAAVFPTALRGDGEIDIASTPKGRDNMFALLRDNPQFEHSTVTLDDAIAAGLQVDREQIRRSIHDDEIYRQEFGCEFLDESSAFLTYEQIARVEDPQLAGGFDAAALADCRGELYCGVDVGRVRDLTVMWVFELCDGVLVTRAVRESVNEPFRRQSEALHGLLANRRLRKCCIDAGGIGMAMAEAAVEAFGAARVEPVTLTAAVKDQLASRLRMRVEDATLRIPCEPAIRNDWHSVRRSVTAAGPARYDSSRAEGSHADRFWAACLAVRATENATPPMGDVGLVQSGPFRYARNGVW
ncbi:MAG TPA: terminase family protein [Phycisphaerae bacterium]|nr:terminase family protein [Phycisphaerae bacterium]